jgi:AraC family transcriptional regulator of adaptative response / DNA-3-methyladenine glycosylase II
VYRDVESCLVAVRAKDRRFDGVFYSAVTSTGIYCRPSCPAITPKAANLRFYPTAAAAQSAGFRACKRCRPDATPGSPEWNMRGDVAARALRLIYDGTIEREGVPGLADRLGYSERQLQRICEAELGATPLALARSFRAQIARTLLESTSLAMPDVAYGAGFASVRQFNATVAEVYAMTPSDLRRRSGDAPAAIGGEMTVKLAVRGPLHVVGLFGHLVATAVPGVESWDEGWYRRSLRLAHGAGALSLCPAEGHVDCALELEDVRDLASALARARRLLDLDADPYAIDAHLAKDRSLAPLVRRAPGRRIPGAVDGAEFALRMVLGQQVSTAGARTTTARLAESLGEAHRSSHPSVTRLFPSPEAIAAARDADLPIPGGRRDTLRLLADSIATGKLDLSIGADRAEATSQLATLRGVGPWTCGQVLMRALGDPDVLLEGDLGVREAARQLGLTTPAALRERAERWRPWRSYAVQHLWGMGEHPINSLAGVSDRPTHKEKR